MTVQPHDHMCGVARRHLQPGREITQAPMFEAPPESHVVHYDPAQEPHDEIACWADTNIFLNAYRVPGTGWKHHLGHLLQMILGVSPLYVIPALHLAFKGLRLERSVFGALWHPLRILGWL